MKRIISFISQVVFNIIEFILNVDTSEEFDTRGINQDMRSLSEHNDSIQYSSLNYLYLYRISKMIPLGKNDVFYDLGCGLGRAVFFFSLFRLKKCVGIDISQYYCDLAEENAKRLRIKRTPIEVICSDVTKVEISDATVIFLFNPFGKKTLRVVINSLAESVTANPRKVTIIYYNDLHREAISQSQQFRLQREFTQTHRSSIWQSVM